MIICLLVLLAIISYIIYYIGEYGWYTSLEITGTFLGLIIGFLLLFSILEIASKPLDEKEFEIKYTTYKQIMNESENNDIRDSNLMVEIAEINKEILTHKEYINNYWIGIFYSEKISNYELIKKEENND